MCNRHTTEQRHIHYSFSSLSWLFHIHTSTFRRMCSPFGTFVHVLNYSLSLARQRAHPLYRRSLVYFASPSSALDKPHLTRKRNARVHIQRPPCTYTAAPTTLLYTRSHSDFSRAFPTSHPIGIRRHSFSRPLFHSANILNFLHMSLPSPSSRHAPVFAPLNSSFDNYPSQKTRNENTLHRVFEFESFSHN